MSAAAAAGAGAGGFGGVQGLVGYLADNRIDLLIDATHPFARQISANAERAAERTATAMIRLQRAGFVDEPRTAAAVVAHAEDFEMERRRRIGADHDVERLAGGDRLVRTIAFDTGRADRRLVETDPRELPVAGAFQSVLSRDRVLGCR